MCFKEILPFQLLITAITEPGFKFIYHPLWKFFELESPSRFNDILVIIFSSQISIFHFSKVSIFVQASFQYSSANGTIIDSHKFGLYYLLVTYLSFNSIVCTHSNIKSCAGTVYPHSFVAK